MTTLLPYLDFLLHANLHLRDFFLAHGPWVYGLLFLVIFCETGLVVTPFLPGDSLIFAAGALSVATGGALRLDLLAVVLIAAPLCGDQTNYWVGRLLGAKIPFSPKSRILKSTYLERTQAFYAKWGASTVVVARFVPIVRTFAPFVAGLGRMAYLRYVAFSALGAILWVGLCLGTGALFGNIPLVQKNFSVVVLGIVGVSVLPLLIGAWRSRRK
ncbi:MAG TPA: DedA family protein [Fibrobacteria bacterium]|nr:DedA family protein [Fibrobacteria bacterium]